MTRYVKLLCMLLTVAVLLTGLKMIVVSAQTNSGDDKTEENQVQMLEESDDSDSANSDTQ